MEYQNQELIQKYNYKYIELSRRDWDVLFYIEEQGFSSFADIFERFFKSKGNCQFRLSKLEAFGYIRKKRLIDYFVSRQTGHEKRGYFPHLLSLNIKPDQWIYHIDRSYAEGFGRSQNLFKPTMILHQLILNKVRNYLEREISHNSVFNDPFIQILSFIQFGRNEEIIPDMTIEDGESIIAVEVERTVKGMLRYFERFNYFRDSIYTHVIYYYTDECQLKPLLNNAGSELKFAFAHYTRPDRLIHPVWGVLSLKEYIEKV